MKQETLIRFLGVVLGILVMVFLIRYYELIRQNPCEFCIQKGHCERPFIIEYGQLPYGKEVEINASFAAIEKKPPS